MIQHAFIISLIVLFLHATTMKGHIFEGIKKIIPDDKKIAKPIYACNLCMTFWWGTGIYCIFFLTSWSDWFLTITTASGFAVLWMCALELREAAAKYTK